MIKFEEHKTYATRSICDADHIIRITVARRTAKMIVTTEGQKLRISEYNGVEQVKPWGSYSMAPIVGADDLETPKAAPAEKPSQTLAGLMMEAKSLFSPEELAEIKSIVQKVTSEPMETAKIYNFADYRKAK
jgi:hypothetical protein